MCTNTHTHTQTHTHKRIYRHTHTHTITRLHTCEHTHTYRHTHMHAHVSTHTHTHTHTHMCIHACTHAHAFTHTHTHNLISHSIDRWPGIHNVQFVGLGIGLHDHLNVMLIVLVSFPCHTHHGLRRPCDGGLRVWMNP